MRYMMMIKHTEDYRQADIPAGLYEAMGHFMDDLSKKGQFVGAAGLQPSSEGARVRLSSGTITMTDGPFVETKELVGGYAILDAKTRDEALALARRFMEIHLEHWPTFEGECEIRPLEEEAQPK